MLKRILSFLQDQGYQQDSLLKSWEINQAFDKIISSQNHSRQFPRTVSSEIWELTQKNQNDQVIISEFLQNMEKQNKLRHLLPQSYVYDAGDSDDQQVQERQQQQIISQVQQENQYPTEYKPKQNIESDMKSQEQKNIHNQLTPIINSITAKQSYQTPYKQLQAQSYYSQPNIEQYSQRESIQVRNQPQNQNISQNINATIAQSIGTMGSLLVKQSINAQSKNKEQFKQSQKQSMNTNQLNEENSYNLQQKSQKITINSVNNKQTSKHLTSKYQNNISEKEKYEEIIVQQSQQIISKNIIKSQIISFQSNNKNQKKLKQKKYPSQVNDLSSKKPPKNKRYKQIRNEQNKKSIQYEPYKTEQQIQEELIRDIPRPALKGSIINKTKSPINKGSTLKGSINAASATFLTDRLLRNQTQNVDQKHLSKEQNKKKCISKRWFVPMCLFVFGLIIFMTSFIIHSEIQRLAIQQVILSPENQGIWAHFPGDTQTQIDRNWTFFNITNPDEMLFYNQKPKFHEIQGFKIIEQEDYLNITYINDGDRVQMIDWLHFAQQPQSRNLDQKVKVLNVGGLAYWYNIKIARPTIILQQGLGLLFNTLQTSILENIYTQAINVQFLPQWTDDIYEQIFAPVQLSFDEAWFIWNDPAYGVGNQNNLKYWIQAVRNVNDVDNQTVSEGFNFLMDYFTLSLRQIQYISLKFQDFIQFAVSSVLENSYCINESNCTGRYLAYQQFSTSYVTRNPPPTGTPIQPNDTICLSNITCSGYYPQLSAFYKNVYLERNPSKCSTLVFDPEWMRDIVNYNLSIDKEHDYNTGQNCLFHIGNLDALWDNGTLYDEYISQRKFDGFQQVQQVIQNQYLQNIKRRFNLPSFNHTHVFWQWIKYLNKQVILQNHTNQKLGVANLFANGLYQGFSYLQDNLQKDLLIDLIHYDLTGGNLGDCSTFLYQSFQLRTKQTALKICDQSGQKITKLLISNLTSICTNQFKQGWYRLRNGFNLTLYQLGSLCQYDQSNKQTFGYILHSRKKYLNDLYDCKITPKQYCSDYQLAAIQWSTSQVTLNPPPQLNLLSNHTYKAWNNNAHRFEYSFYRSKYPDDNDFPQIQIEQAYSLLNFDNWFSSTVVLKHFTNQTFNQKFKAYMRYVGLQVGLNGLTMQRSARQLIFGYNDQILLGVKNSYIPFGGDPSTPALVAFNDPNITKQQATMTLQWSTGKYNSSLVSQYRKINNQTFLTIQKDVFNGNVTKTILQSPWQGEDYFYGTTAKQFAPNQFDQPNISLYVPNIQRYGSGVIDQSSTQTRFGFDLQLGYLGDYIYESTGQSDINKRYYQNFHAIFNQTSVVGFPLYVCKNHFMNVSSNWSDLVQIYNQNGSIHYINASQYDDSFVVVQPYTGLSFQSTIYLQSNYYHTPDSLLGFYKQSLLPIFSLARSGNVSESVANDLLGPLKLGLAAVQWTRIIGIVIVVISCIVCGLIYYQKKKADKQLQEQERQSQAQEQQREQKQQQSKRALKSSQLGISLQPMSPGQRPSNKEKYIPPPVTQQEI